jgi:PKHD-type hydroxylase
MVKTNAVYWQNFVSLEDRKLILDKIEKDYDFLEKSDQYKNSIKNMDRVKCVKYENIKHIPTIKSIINEMYEANKQVIGFDLHTYTDNQVLNLNSYELNKSYEWHKDSTPTPHIDIKLTGLIDLSTEDYEGGEFQMNEGAEKTIEQFSKGGDMILFRSHILHRVLPVKKGKRKSLAVFLTGPNFK